MRVPWNWTTNVPAFWTTTSSFSWTAFSRGFWSKIAFGVALIPPMERPCRRIGEAAGNVAAKVAGVAVVVPVVVLLMFDAAAAAAAAVVVVVADFFHSRFRPSSPAIPSSENEEAAAADGEGSTKRRLARLINNTPITPAKATRRDSGKGSRTNSRMQITSVPLATSSNGR
mmetsp:Transcript_41127/g.86261  ORF Transcript_41127/g.86261 Transcript_41127/m.86261 type:complete len:171 (-) Transcript_41127:399-911(-)